MREWREGVREGGRTEGRTNGRTDGLIPIRDRGRRNRRTEGCAGARVRECAGCECGRIGWLWARVYVCMSATTF